MPRRSRIVIPGLPHHITQRGNRRMNVFVDAEDRQVFLRMLRENSELYFLRNYSYCLMTNHIHLISNPDHATSLLCTMRDLLGPYASYFNRKHGLSGRLWQGRFYSTVLDDEHFWTAMRYAELNPVRAGMTQRAEQYQWSSASAHCSLADDPLLSPLPAGASLIGNWSEWLNAGNSASELKFIRDCTKTGRPCGTESYIRELERRTGRVLVPRRVGRPRKQALTDDVDSRDAKSVQRSLFLVEEKCRK